MTMQILSENAIIMADLKKEMDKIKKRDGELSFRANKTEEYLNSVSDRIKGSDKIVEKLAALKIPRLKENHIAKIADIKPKTIKELKIIIQAYPISINSENLNKILKAVKE